MSVSLEALSDFFEHFFDDSTCFSVSEQGISFRYRCGDTCVFVTVCPVDVVTRVGLLEAAGLVFTFCKPDGELLNIAHLSDEQLEKILDCLSAEAAWGKVETQDVSETVEVLIHHRLIQLRSEDLLPVEDDYQLSYLAGQIGIMHDEWLQLNNIFSFICSTPGEVLEEQIDLLLSPCEGRA